MTQDHDATGAGLGGDISDVVRELLLGLASQIDNLAAMFAGQPGNVAVANHDLPGDISALFGEIGELLARLIATLIAVLEAIAKALRPSATGATSTASAQYQPIEVRIDPSGNLG